MSVEQIFIWRCDHINRDAKCDYKTEWSDGFIPYGMQILKANPPPGWTIVVEETRVYLLCPKHKVEVHRA